MTHSTATRRLVKSPPELWAELSSEESLGRRLAEFGEIRIIRVDPETTVAWEGDRASGTVELAPTGWGTKVILTAQPSEQPERPPAVADEPQAATPSAPVPTAAPPQAERSSPQPPPEPPVAHAPEPRRGFFARLLRRRPPAPSAGIPGPPLPAPDPTPPTPAPDPSPLPPAPDPVPPTPVPTPPAPQIEVLDPARTSAILDEVLDDLGAAHHRPFSRE